MATINQCDVATYLYNVVKFTVVVVKNNKGSACVCVLVLVSGKCVSVSGRCVI
jgi:hypothetical protein